MSETTREVLKGRPGRDGDELHDGYHPTFAIAGAPGTIIKETTVFSRFNRRYARERILRKRDAGEEVVVDRIYEA